MYTSLSFWKFSSAVFFYKNENSSFLLSTFARNSCQFPRISAVSDTRCRMPVSLFPLSLLWLSVRDNGPRQCQLLMIVLSRGKLLGRKFCHNMNRKSFFGQMYQEGSAKPWPSSMHSQDRTAHLSSSLRVSATAANWRKSAIPNGRICNCRWQSIPNITKAERSGVELCMLYSLVQLMTTS